MRFAFLRLRAIVLAIRGGLWDWAMTGPPRLGRPQFSVCELKFISAPYNVALGFVNLLGFLDEDDPRFCVASLPY